MVADRATHIANLIFYSARKCKNLRDQTKHSQMSLSPGLPYPVSILFSSKKSSSAAQILHGIHLRIFPRAESLNSTMESILCSSSHCRVESGVTGNNLKWEFQRFYFLQGCFSLKLKYFYQNTEYNLAKKKKKSDLFCSFRGYFGRQSRHAEM